MNLLGKVLATISIFFGSLSIALGYSEYSHIGATVKISVCGNNIVEDMEDCEVGLNEIFNCKDFGFQEKEILCDISCAYDLLLCVPIPPTKPEIEENPMTTPSKIEDNTPKLPLLINLWDSNSNGKLELTEFATFVKEWVGQWKSFISLTTDKPTDEKIEVARTCDINYDNICNLKDFSIILYHYSNE